MGKRAVLVCGVCLLAVLQAGAVSPDSVSRVYNQYVGVREATGRNDGPEVERFLAVTGLEAGAPWCAAFVSYCFLEAGVEAVVSAWSPAFFPNSHTVYRRGTRRARRFVAQRADVFGIYHERLRRIAHVGFIDSEEGDYYITVEGNTNEAGSREGVGVLRKRRSKRAVAVVSRWVK